MLLVDTNISNKVLNLLIEVKRNEMIEMVQKKGLISYETIRCSQELDSLLNTFQNSFHDIISNNDKT